MGEARSLLAEAEERLAHDRELAALPVDVAWMHRALAHVRGQRIPVPALGALARLVAVKYVLCLAAAGVPIALAVVLAEPWLALAAPLAFYLVEAQLVFLLLVAADGSAHPWRDARRRTSVAGGTLRVVATVVPIALFMLVAGIAGRGLVRAWLTGCLAIVLWHERLPHGSEESA